jgi:hypothetical protein
MRASRGSLVLAIAALWTAFASAGQVPETFTATASVKKGAASASAPFTVTVTRYASDAEREVVLKAVRDGGAAGLRKALSTLDDAGFVQLGERRTPIKFASERPTTSGRLVTIVASAPILFLGAGIPDAKPATGLEVGVAMLDLQQGGEGLGELAPAAKVGTDKNGALLIEDYGPTVMWLKGLVGAK